MATKTKTTKAAPQTASKPAWAENLPHEVAPIPGGWLILSNPPVKVEDPTADHCPVKRVPTEGLYRWLVGETGKGPVTYTDLTKSSENKNPFGVKGTAQAYDKGLYYHIEGRHWLIDGYYVTTNEVHSVHYGSAYFQWTLRKGKAVIAQGAESTVAIALARELGYGIA